MAADQPDSADAEQRSESSLSSCRDERDWQAFQYLTGELPPDAARDFERQLADDPRVRMSLVRMTQLHELLAASQNLPAVPTPGPVATGRGDRSAARWGLAVATLCLVVTAVVSWSSVSDAPERRESTTQQSDAAAAPESPVEDSEQLATLVEFWTHSSSPQDSLAPDTGAFESEADGAGLADSSTLSASSFVDVPGWMLVAVADLQEPGSGEAMPEADWETN